MLSPSFVSADPPSGSLLPETTTITVLFDSTPRELLVTHTGVKVSAFKVKYSGETITISGNFHLGEAHPCNEVAD